MKRLRELLKRWFGRKTKEPEELRFEHTGPVIGAVTDAKYTDGGIVFSADLKEAAAKKLGKMPRSTSITFDLTPISYYADDQEVETVYIKTPKETEKKRCAYCGCIAEKDYGTCEHCGAPL